MAKNRIKTKYPGVFYHELKTTSSRRAEKVYYIRYRRNGKMIEEKAGYQFRDDMTPARVAGLRAKRIEGAELSNNEKRAEQRKKEWTLETLAHEYFSVRDNAKSAKTDQGRFRLYLKNPFGKKRPEEIDQLSIDRLRIKLLKTKTPQTVKHVLGLMTRIINFGADRGLCQRLPYRVKMPRVDNHKTEDLSPTQLNNLLQVLENTPRVDAARMMKIALFSGMRRSEIFKLRWEDIDFERGFITIMNPKGGKSQKIPLNNNVRETLAEVIRTSDYVFPGRNGGPRRDANKAFSAIKREAGLPENFRAMHGLRHVYATILASSGEIDMLTLQKLLTHKDQRMTQRYIHYHEEALQRAGKKTDDKFNHQIKEHSVELQGTG
jgi:integrase